MNFKFTAPKFHFKAPSFGSKPQAEVFGVENSGITIQTQMDEEDWGVFRRYNNREVTKRHGRIKPIHADYVAPLMPSAGHESFLLLNGNCQGVDVLMAMIAATTRHFGPPEELILSSLSMNMDSFDKLEQIKCKKHLLISSYFLATNPKNIIGRLYRNQQLDNWKIGMWRNHTKHALWSCGGQWFFFHGSANLRSSGSIESMSWYNSEALYKFNRQWMMHLIDRVPISDFIVTGKTNTNGFFSFLDRDAVKLDLKGIQKFDADGND